MLKLYFGSITSIISTILILVFIVFFGLVISKRSSIHNWGTLVLLLFLFGLLMSFLSGVKDSVATAASVIPAKHWVMSALCIMGGVAFVIGAISLFVRKQEFWQVNFYILSGVIIAKILLTEVFRIAAYFKALS